MTSPTPDIQALAEWSAPKEIQTKHGPRLLSKAKVTDSFSAAWKVHKEWLKAQGASWSKNDRSGEWELCWWQVIPSEVKAPRDEAFTASRALSADIEIPCPPGLRYMPFQKAGIAYALKREGTLIGDDMGTGKTIMTAGFINAHPTVQTVLIVCPKTVKLNWRKELTKWLTKPLTVGVVTNGTWPATDIVITNYESLAKLPDLDQRGFDLCVLDEAHYIKNKKAQRSKNAKAIRARLKLRLTGTPIVNRPAELQNLIEDLPGAEWAQGFSYLRRYCNAQRTRFGWDFSGASNLDELQRKLRETVMIRRTKAETFPEMPAKIRQVIELEPETAAQRAVVQRESAYEEASDDRLTDLRVLVELSKAESDAAYREAVARLKQASQADFTEISRLRHATALAKLPMAMDHVKECMADDPDKKIIIGAHHHDVIDQLMELCAGEGWNPVSLTGQHTDEQRQQAVDQFQENPSVRVFIGGIQAAGLGITLTAASNVIFVELDWVPGVVSQFEDRSNRLGQENRVLVQHLVLSGSIDARMADTLISKQEVIDASLDTNHPARTESVYTPKASTATAQVKPADLVITLTPAQVTAIHTGLKMLAGLDWDGAQELNDIGYSKVDTGIGHSLASRLFLTDKQAALGAKLCNKYRRQLPADLLKTIKGEPYVDHADQETSNSAVAP